MKIIGTYLFLIAALITGQFQTSKAVTSKSDHPTASTYSIIRFDPRIHFMFDRNSKSIRRTLSIFQLLNLYAKTTGMVCANGIKAVKKSDKPGFTKERNIAITNKIRPENEIIFFALMN